MQLSNCAATFVHKSIALSFLENHIIITFRVFLSSSSILLCSTALFTGPDEEQQNVEAHHTVVFGDGDTIKVQNKVRRKTLKNLPSSNFPVNVFGLLALSLLVTALNVRDSRQAWWFSRYFVCQLDDDYWTCCFLVRVLKPPTLCWSLGSQSKNLWCNMVRHRSSFSVSASVHYPNDPSVHPSIPPNPTHSHLRSACSLLILNSWLVSSGCCLNEGLGCDCFSGPFVMTTEEEIKQAILDYKCGRNGFERSINWRSKIRDAFWRTLEHGLAGSWFLTAGLTVCSPHTQ